MVAPQIFGAWLDGSSVELRRLLGELEGVSEETLRRIDRVSRPTGDGPIPRFPDDVQLYERLVMLAFCRAPRLSGAEAEQGQGEEREVAVSGERLDPADLARTRWVAADRIVKSAWSMTRERGLDPGHAERIERAAADDDLDALELAVAELLEALT